jgi:hypothetical protein
MISSGQAGSFLPFAITVYYTMNSPEEQTFDSKKTAAELPVHIVCQTSAYNYIGCTKKHSEKSADGILTFIYQSCTICRIPVKPFIIMNYES